MMGEDATKDSGGRQPDMERGLEAAAKAGGVKPPSQTNQALPEDAAGPSDLSDEQAKAAEILRRNAEKDTHLKQQG